MHHRRDRLTKNIRCDHSHVVERGLLSGSTWTTRDSPLI